MYTLVTYVSRLLLAIGWLLGSLGAARAQVLKGTFAAGSAHSLAIHADGTLWATGSNLFGELGDGTTTNRKSWAQVGTSTDWVQVAAGEFCSFALQANGTLYAWGYNNYGQLGLAATSGTSQPNTTPTALPGTWMQVVAGIHHTLALRANGTLWAWGQNTFGQLGTLVGQGLGTPNPTPTQIPGSWTQAAAGEYHTLALAADGSVYAWGSNYNGQLSGTAGLGPVLVPGTYSQIAAGRDHSLGLRADGSLWAWGSNQYGQLGNTTNLGTVAANPTPTQVAGTYARLGSGNFHSVALRADGSFWAWGSNARSQLGIASTTALSPTPLQVAGTYVQLAGGGNHNLALRADGNLWTWGEASFGQLGNVLVLNTPTPAATGTALPTRSTALSTSAGFAIKADGTLWSWGTNMLGLLGSATPPDRLRPGQVGTDRDWVQVVAGQQHGLALKANGTVWAWGNNANGELGQGHTAVAPTLVPVPLPTPVVQLAAGGTHSLALTASGVVYGWGRNTYGEAGQPAAAVLATPATLASSLAFVQLAGGTGHSLARTATGQAYAWGLNQFGQLGTATSVGLPVANAAPLPVTGLGAVRQLAAGSVHSLALTTTGLVYAWGSNSFGQLGMASPAGSGTAVSQPLMLAGLPSAMQLAGGRFQSLALCEGGRLYSWGMNFYGQLGQGTTAGNPNYQFAQEATGSTAWATLGTGIDNGYSLARTASGLTFASAGRNDMGQLGDGTTTDWPRFDRLSPLVSLQPLPVLAAAPGAGFALVPNPASGQTTALGLPAGTSLAVYDALGRLARTTAGATLEVSGLAPGMYVVRATAPGQPTKTSRLVVE